MSEPLRLPIPWFGGKRRAAPLVWQLLGDVGHYVEPFCGTAAVLLGRPADHTGALETLNDADGLVVNGLRAIRDNPRAVTWHAAQTLTEVDVHAWLAVLNEKSRDEDWVAWLKGNPYHYDPELAGWWLYTTAASIGYPLGHGGPWHRVDGHLRNRPDLGGGINASIPKLASVGDGVFRASLRPKEALHDLLEAIAKRLRHVRIACGDWRRVVTPAILRPNTRLGGDHAHGIFLDPPYQTSGDVYQHGDNNIAADVREWCLTADPAWRIVLCGFEAEHDQLLTHGWTKHEGRSGSGNGYNKNPAAGRRERLWASPACQPPPNPTLFEEGNQP